MYIYIHIRGFPKIRVPFGGVQIIRIRVFGSILGSVYLGKLSLFLFCREGFRRASALRDIDLGFTRR